MAAAGVASPAPVWRITAAIAADGLAAVAAEAGVWPLSPGSLAAAVDAGFFDPGMPDAAVESCSLAAAATVALLTAAAARFGSMSFGSAGGMAATFWFPTPELFAVVAGGVEAVFAGAGLASGLDAVPLGAGAGCLAALVAVLLARELEFPVLPVEPVEGV